MKKFGEIKNRNIWLGTIFFVALALRFFQIFFWSRTPYWGVPLIDADIYNRWAIAIAKGEIFGKGVFYGSPLYPYLLAGFYKLFGQNFILIFIVQAFVSAMTCVVLALATEIGFGFGAAIIAGFAAAIYGPFIFYVPILLKETWSLFGFAVFAYFALKTLHSSKKRNFVLCGLALGVTALLRGNALLLAPVLVLFWFSKLGRKSILNILFFGFFFILPILPATIHNWVIGHDLVLINYNAGANFYFGNSASTNGLGLFPANISSVPGEEENDVVAIAEKEIGHSLKPSEVSKFWFSKAFDYISGNFSSWIKLSFRKLYAFWNYYEQPDNYFMSFANSHFQIVTNWLFVGFAAISILAWLGFLITVSTIETQLLAAMTFTLTASIVGFVVTDRYRLHAVIFLIPLAAKGFVTAVKFLNNQPHIAKLSGMFVNSLSNHLNAEKLSVTPTESSVASDFNFLKKSYWYKAAFAILILVCIITFAPTVSDPVMDDANAWAQLAFVYEYRGEHERSVESLAQAWQLRPAAVGAAAILKGAEALVALNHPAKAEQLLLDASKVYPQTAMIFNNLGVVQLAQAGQIWEGDQRKQIGQMAQAGQPPQLAREKLKTAATAFEKANELQPTLAEPYKNLAATYFLLKDLHLASRYVEQALVLDPSDEKLKALAEQIKIAKPL